MQKIINKICSKIEQCSIPRINWLKTLYFNFRILPFTDAIKLPFLIYGSPALNSLSGNVEFQCPIKRGMVKINIQHTFAPSLQTLDSQICIYGTLVIGGEVIIGRANKILVAHGARLEMANHTKIMDFCNIDCWLHISLKEGTLISHRCQIMDSNHHYVIDETSKRKIIDNRRPIVVGKYVWLCNSVTVNPGSIIPEHTIVSSNSLVNKDISAWGNYIVVGGVPVRLLKKGVSRVCNSQWEQIIFNSFISSGTEAYLIPMNVDIYELLQQ